jgi:hypothetical protein
VEEKMMVPACYLDRECKLPHREGQSRQNAAALIYLLQIEHIQVEVKEGKVQFIWLNIWKRRPTETECYGVLHTFFSIFIASDQ